MNDPITTSDDFFTAEEGLSTRISPPPLPHKKKNRPHAQKPAEDKTTVSTPVHAPLPSDAGQQTHGTTVAAEQETAIKAESYASQGKPLREEITYPLVNGRQVPVVTENTKNSSYDHVNINRTQPNNDKLTVQVGETGVTAVGPPASPRSRPVVKPRPRNTVGSSSSHPDPDPLPEGPTMANQDSVQGRGVGYLLNILQDDKVSSPPAAVQPPPVQPHPTPAQPRPPALQPPTPTTPTNHMKRLRSGNCREDWILPPKKSSSISEEEEVFTLPQLVEEHSKNFPLSVMVVKGLEEHFPPRSVVDVCFLKQTQVVDMSDSASQRYLVPYNSALKFGLIYCPGVKTESYFFEKVSDIIQAQDLPKVVTCTKQSKSKGKNLSVSVNEVLIVIEVVNSQRKSTKKSKLKVFSFTTKEEKILPGNLMGSFTTDPKLATFYLPDIIKHVPDAFPVSARLFLDASTGEESPQLPVSLMREPIMILDSTIEMSLIASFSSPSSSSSSEVDGTSSNGKLSIVELPLSQDIQVVIVSRENYPHEKSNSLKKSNNLKKSNSLKLDSLDPLHARVINIWRDLLSPASEKAATPKRLTPTTGGDSTQHKLLSVMVRKGWEREAQAIKAPPLLTKDLPVDIATPQMKTYQVLLDWYMPLLSSSLSSDCYSTVDCDDDDDNESVSTSCSRDADEEPFSADCVKKASPANTLKEEDYEKEFQSHRRLIRRIEALELRVSGAAPHDKVQRLTRRMEALESRLPSPPLTKRSVSKEREDELKAEVESLRAALKMLEDHVKVMQDEMKEMAKKMRTLPKVMANAGLHHGKQQTPQENIAELKAMDTEQIIKLLEALDLHDYKGPFLEEAITGEILAECDEEVLVQDLGMRDKTQNSKLMKIIRGECSPLATIADDAYVRFKKSSLV